MITFALPKTTALVDAVAAFNAAFDMDLRLPLWPRDLESAAIIAELRGRKEIADQLREAAGKKAEVAA